MLLRNVLCLCMLWSGAELWAQQSARDADDQETIRQCVDQYVDAFNRGDAAAIARLWSEQGVWVSPTGQRLQGREAIEAALNEYFAGAQGQVLAVTDVSIRMLAPTVAVEEGHAQRRATG